MAAGRGEFFRSVLEGLERRPSQPAPGHRSSRQPGPAPGHRPPGGRRRKQRPQAAPSAVSADGGSCLQARPPPVEGLLQRLPSEILVTILSYLDASSLFCLGHVSKLFNQLANDDVMWHKIYMSEFASRAWKPRLADVAALEVDPVEVEDRLAGYWKKMYFRTVAGQEMYKWRRELRDISPHTGLPRHTEWVLRNLNVSWELTVCNCFGWKITLEQSRAYFFESSVIVRWSGGGLPKYHHISNIQLHGVRKEKQMSPRVTTPGWRSLISKLDVRSHPGRLIGKDRLVKLMHLSSGFLVGIWRGQQSVAFIMVSLHFHKLVEKSLLGCPVCPYSEPADLPPEDNSDPEFGLHGYTLHFVLHNTGTEIMSGHFSQLSCRTVQIQHGLVELRVINRTKLSQHRSLSGSIKLPWKSEVLEGSVENCCIVALTLLDEFQKPFWCVSSPVCVAMAKKTLTVDYGGEHFLMEHRSADGRVKMQLVWLKEQQQFFLISLTVYVPVVKVNKHFSRNY